MTRKLHKVFMEKECQLQLIEHEYSQIKQVKNTVNNDFLIV